MIRPVRMPLALADAVRSLDVLAVGENSLDLVAVVSAHPARGSKSRVRRVTRQPGGQVATAATALATLGWRTEYIGRFGEDEGAETGLASLDAAGVRRGRVVRVPGGRSRTAIVLVDETTGERTVLWDEDPDLAITVADVPDEAVATARIVLLDDFGEAALDVAGRARRAGAHTVLDVDRTRPSLHALLTHIDVIIAAEGVPEAITGRPDAGSALEALQADSGAAIVCVTLGPAGSLARACGHEVRTPAYHVPVVDTTGAGDLFRAGFIHGWLGAGEDLEGVLRHANAAAALGCLGLGARGHLPSTDEVAALVESGR